MNLQCSPISDPLKVLVVNPLSPSAQMMIVKILSGKVFGNDQLIDVTLLVYSNETTTAEAFKYELNKCAFSCTNNIAVSSDLPSISDADVFCFITNFTQPNSFDFENAASEDLFDALYLIIKIAHNLEGTLPQNLSKELTEKQHERPDKTRKPIFMCDGLIAMDILKTLSKNMPSEIFFCSTPLTNIAKRVLGDHLKIRCDVLNEVLVWAANDKIFHVEVESPIVKNEGEDNDIIRETLCPNDLFKSKENLESIKLDHTQFNHSWLKNEFIEKIATSAASNPYGHIFKASQFAKNLKEIWSSRVNENGEKLCTNLGVISDGSLETIKGLPYVLPVILCGDSWSVNTKYRKEPQLQLEIKRLNKAAKEHREKFIPYCKKFLKDNVLNQMLVPIEEDSETFQRSKSLQHSYD